jgi:Xaa-Pro aminopeptidase
MDIANFARRRARAAEMLGEDSALIVAAAPELHMGLDGEVRYQPDASLYWLSGFTEPEAVLVLCPSSEWPFVLFVRPRDPEREVWTGPRGGTEAACAEYGAHAAFPITELSDRLPRLVGHVDTLYARIEYGRPVVDAVVLAMLVASRRSRPRTGRGPHTLVDPSVLLDPMRRVKDAAELAAIGEAARITVESFHDAIARVRPDAGEWEVEAALESGFRTRGALGPAFPTIVASGPNAVTLHHTSNDRRMRAEELVLMDAGARAAMYCADITRTVPVGGRFTPEQRALHDIVLAAHDAAITAAVPGGTVADMHARAVRVLTHGLVELGLLRGGIDELIESGEYRRFYPHRTSHWLGLDVHDVGDYVEGGHDVPLEPGMVLTVEPGLYIPVDTDAGPTLLRGSGVRIEDDVLVTEHGPDVLTRGLPTDPDRLLPLMH